MHKMEGKKKKKNEWIRQGLPSPLQGKIMIRITSLVTLELREP